MYPSTSFAGVFPVFVNWIGAGMDARSNGKLAGKTRLIQARWSFFQSGVGVSGVIAWNTTFRCDYDIRGFFSIPAQFFLNNRRCSPARWAFGSVGAGAHA